MIYMASFRVLSGSSLCLDFDQFRVTAPLTEQSNVSREGNVLNYVSNAYYMVTANGFGIVSTEIGQMLLVAYDGKVTKGKEFFPL